MKPEILFLKHFYDPTMAELEKEFTVHKAWEIPNGVEGIKQRCTQVRAAICTDRKSVV